MGMIGTGVMKHAMHTRLMSAVGGGLVVLSGCEALIVQMSGAMFVQTKRLEDQNLALALQLETATGRPASDWGSIPATPSGLSLPNQVIHALLTSICILYLSQCILCQSNAVSFNRPMKFFATHQELKQGFGPQLAHLGMLSPVSILCQPAFT